MRDRHRQRKLLGKQKAVKLLDKRDSFGMKDLTAYNAVLQIKTKNKANIVLT